MTVGRVGKQISRRDGVSGPDDLTRLEVPPHIVIGESRPNRHHASTARGPGNITGKERIRRRTVTITADSVRSMAESAVFKPSPYQDLPVR
jgi:hypothetical protein